MLGVRTTPLRSAQEGPGTWAFLEVVGLSAVLLLTLCLGWRLLSTLESFHFGRKSQQPLERPRVEAFGMEAGISSSGEVISPIPPPEIVETVLFLLRDRSLLADISYWNRVSAALPARFHIRLVAYCDGVKCASDLPPSSALLFPVILYGEVTGAQALLNADDDGCGFIRTERDITARRIRWRTYDRSEGRVTSDILEVADAETFM